MARTDLQCAALEAVELLRAAHHQVHECLNRCKPDLPFNVEEGKVLCDVDHKLIQLILAARHKTA